jgi:hypothetical protein
MRVVTVTITEHGQRFVAGHGSNVFCEVGESTVQRASHVEPDNSLLRWLFHFIRQRCTDTSGLAAFTRRWPCLWRVNIVNGPILKERWLDRESAISAEIEFLNRWWLEKGCDALH